MRKVLMAAVAALAWHSVAFAQEDKPKFFRLDELSSALPYDEACRAILATSNDTYEVHKGGLVTYHGQEVYNWVTNHRLVVVKGPADVYRPGFCVYKGLEALKAWETEARIRQGLKP